VSLRILLIDDHDGVRAAIRDVLANAFGTTSVFGEATTVASGLRLAQLRQWDVAVVDIHLPDGSGLDVVRKLAAMRPGMRIVVVSALESYVYAPIVEAIGARFVAKHAIASELVQIVGGR
jgi:two-component system, NarL family, response regulator DevR